MVDFQLDIYKKIHPDHIEPEELIQKREDVWRMKYDRVRFFFSKFRRQKISFSKELERRKKYQELCARISHDKATAFGSPDVEVRHDSSLLFFVNFIFSFVQEGPRSTLKEDEFFDAIDQSLDRIDRETDSHQRSVNIFFFL